MKRVHHVERRVREQLSHRRVADAGPDVATDEAREIGLAGQGGDIGHRRRLAVEPRRCCVGGGDSARRWIANGGSADGLVALRFVTLRFGARRLVALRLVELRHGARRLDALRIAPIGLGANVDANRGANRFVA
jgi:hypothetical protein